MDASTPGTFGKYEIIGILGRGGTGEVVLARDSLGRKVAIKRPFPNPLADGLISFQVEARAATLDHPNIPAIYELGEQDGLPFIVMEYVEGESLDKIIKSGKPLDLILKLSIIEQVCSALGYAHKKGIIHCDIEPTNVIVRADGVAKIIDFGIAMTQTPDGNPRLTQTSQLIGTLHYLAPERLKGEAVDGRADIFSTGVMLYQLLTGHLLFAEGEVFHYYRIVNEVHSPLSTHINNYPPALDAILTRALAKNPEDRYATAEGFADSLEEVISDLKWSRASQMFDEAERLSTQGRLGPALERFKEATQLDPTNLQAGRLRTLLSEKLEAEGGSATTFIQRLSQVPLEVPPAPSLPRTPSPVSPSTAGFDTGEFTRKTSADESRAPTSAPAPANEAGREKGRSWGGSSGPGAFTEIFLGSPLKAEVRNPDGATLVGVFYATDRMQLPTLKKNAQYSRRRALLGRLHYGRCEVSIPSSHKLGKLETPSILRLEFRPDPKK